MNRQVSWRVALNRHTIARHARLFAYPAKHGLVSHSACVCAGYLDWADTSRPDAGHQYIDYYMYHINNPWAFLHGEPLNVSEVCRPLIHVMCSLLCDVTRESGGAAQIPLPGEDVQRELE